MCINRKDCTYEKGRKNKITIKSSCMDCVVSVRYRHQFLPLLQGMPCFTAQATVLIRYRTLRDTYATATRFAMLLSTCYNMILTSGNCWLYFLFLVLVQVHDPKWVMSTVTDVRFTNATSNATGLVQVKYNEEWLYLCRNSEDYAREARVICRQMDYVGGWPQHYIKTNVAGVVIHCGRGNERNLSFCQVNNGRENCTGGIIIRVQCYNDTAARLVDGPGDRPNTGRVQVQYYNIWTDVCFQGRGEDRDWDHTHNNLKVICKQLGYPGALFSLNFTLNNWNITSNKAIEDYQCIGDESGLNQCVSDTPMEGSCAENYVQVGCAPPSYVGCFPLPSGRMVDMQTNSTMTTRTCIDYCRDHHARYAGLQMGYQCFCLAADLQEKFHDKNALDDSDCNYTCSGDEYDVCGGQNTISVHDVTLGYCDDPDVPQNGSIKDNSTFHFGSIVTFDCDPGFALFGSPSIQCVLGSMPNESIWKGAIPTCEAIPTPIPTTPKTSEGVPGEIIGVVVAIMVVLMLICIVVYFIYRRNQRSPTSASSKKQTTTPDLSPIKKAIESDSFSTETNKSPSDISLMYAKVAKQNPASAGSNRNDLNPRQSQHIYTYAEVNGLTQTSSGGPTGIKDTNRPQSQHQYAYADISKQNPSNGVGSSNSEGKKVSADLQYAYAYSHAPKGNPTITKNSVDSLDHGKTAPRPTADNPYAYADVTTALPKDPKQPQPQPYAYAEVNGSAKNTSREPILPANDGQNQEGWSENVLYTKSTLDGNLPDGSHGKGSEKEKDGWVENVVYAKGAGN